MTRRVIQTVTALSAILALVLIASVVRPRRPLLPGMRPAASVVTPTPPRLAPSPVSSGDPESEDPIREQLQDLSVKLVADFMADQGRPSPFSSWIDIYSVESELLYESKEGRRWITLASARVDCEAVDRALAELTDPAMGRAESCDRWLEETRVILDRHGLGGEGARSFLQNLGVDTSVRVLLVYAGWTQDAETDSPGPSDAEEGLQSIRLVHAHAADVYPQSEFGTARRAALDEIMRSLKLGPYADDLVPDTVAMLLNW